MNGQTTMKCCNRKCRTYKRYGYHWCVRCDSVYSIQTGQRIGTHGNDLEITTALRAERSGG